eukprot:1799459-Pyramimonas_sp.AAC.1
METERRDGIRREPLRLRAHRFGKHLTNVASFYGSSCANNGKDALDIPDTRKVVMFVLLSRIVELCVPYRSVYLCVPLGVSLTSFYGSSCANNGEGALNTLESVRAHAVDGVSVRTDVVNRAVDYLTQMATSSTTF